VATCNEYPPGSSFSTRDQIQLVAHMSKIARDIPNFHIPKEIILQHPIEITKPEFLRTMTPGQDALFFWTVVSRL
jgi:hypothetical protein